MTFDTQMTLALLQELLRALRANDSDAFKAWLLLGIERLGEPAVIELMVDWFTQMTMGPGRGLPMTR
jgi:hypothetical protein